MRIICPKCETEYDLDESQLSPEGTPVQCSACEHTFNAYPAQNTSGPTRRMASADVNRGTDPMRRPAKAKAPRVGLGGTGGLSSRKGSNPNGAVVPPPPPLSGGGGRLFLAQGDRIYKVKDIATLQRWVVEKRVLPGDRLSRDGKSWDVVSSVAELRPFFAVLDQLKTTKKALSKARKQSAAAPTSPPRRERPTPDRISAPKTPAPRREPPPPVLPPDGPARAPFSESAPIEQARAVVDAGADVSSSAATPAAPTDVSRLRAETLSARVLEAPSQADLPDDPVGLPAATAATGELPPQAAASGALAKQVADSASDDDGDDGFGGLGDGDGEGADDDGDDGFGGLGDDGDDGFGGLGDDDGEGADDGGDDGFGDLGDDGFGDLGDEGVDEVNETPTRSPMTSVSDEDLAASGGIASSVPVDDAPEDDSLDDDFFGTDEVEDPFTVDPRASGGMPRKSDFKSTRPFAVPGTTESSDALPMPSTLHVPVEDAPGDFDPHQTFSDRDAVRPVGAGPGAGFMVMLAAVVLLAIGAAWYFLLGPGRGAPTAVAANEPSTASAPEPTPTPLAEPTAGDAAEGSDGDAAADSTPATEATPAPAPTPAPASTPAPEPTPAPVKVERPAQVAARVETPTPAPAPPPKSASALVTAGNRARDRGDYSGAVQAYTAALELEPRNARTVMDLGWVQVELGRSNDAVATFKKAVGLAPSQAEPHYGLGLAYQGMGRKQDAISEYRKVIELDPAGRDTREVQAILRRLDPSAAAE